MSEEMINLESYDTLGIKMDNPTATRLRELPHPPFFMDPKKALPFWLVRPLEDKIPMTSIPLKIKTPYTRGRVGEALVHSKNPNQFAVDDMESKPVNYQPLHDPHLKRFFDKPSVRRLVEAAEEVVDGRTVCSLKDHNDYRAAVHKMLLGFVADEQRDAEKLKERQLQIDRFLLAAKKDGKERWNQKFKEYLKAKREMVRNEGVDVKKRKCQERIARVDRCNLRAKQLLAAEKEARKANWAAYKKRVETYFKTVQNEQRKRRLYATMKWRTEAVINEHRKSLVVAESKMKREATMETNWNRRMRGQELKLKKDKLVREQYRACIELMRHRREQYYDRKDVEVDELLALPNMNSLEELEIFNTQVDEFSPEFLSALNGAKFFMNRSGRSLTLDKSLRKFITHHESAAERMKKAYVAGPIKHALDLLIRRSVGYYTMVVTHRTILDNRDLALRLASKIKDSPQLRELLLEEYRRFGPRSDVPYQTVLKFDEQGLDHCMCDYALINKDDLTWPCPLCRRDDKSSSSSSLSSLTVPEDFDPTPQEEIYVVDEAETAIEFLVPPKTTEGVPEIIVADNVIQIEPLVVETTKPPIVEKIVQEPQMELELIPSPPSEKKTSTGSKRSKKSTRLSGTSKKSKRSEKSRRKSPTRRAIKSKSTMSKGKKKKKELKGKKSILKRKGKGKGKVPTKKVSFAQLVRTSDNTNEAPTLEQATLVKAANDQLDKLSVAPSRSSVVSLLSITSDDRLHFVKGQCLHGPRGSLFGKIGDQNDRGKSPKRGYIRGKCTCNASKESYNDSAASNITERLNDVKPGRKRVSRLRWKARKPQPDESSASNQQCSRNTDLQTIIQNWSPDKKLKLKHLLKADDLQIICKCRKCYNMKKSQKVVSEEERLELQELCKCAQRQTRKMTADKVDRLEYIQKVVGKEYKRPESICPERIKESVGKLSIRTMIDRHKSIISRFFGKKTYKDVAPLALKREPVVEKYYVDDVGDLYVLNRRGQKTVLCNVGENFRIDGDGKKYFVDEFGLQYLIDVTGRVYLQNEEGDLNSLFHEDGKQYVDPEPKKLLLHDLVRESIVDLVHEGGLKEEIADNEDFVEMVYEYVFEGLSNAELQGGNGDSERSSSAEDLGVNSGKAVQSAVKPYDNPLGPRMPIKRSLNSLINEVPRNRDISRLFIQRKKFQDCSAIVYRRCLLYSLAKYTNIVEKGFDPLAELEERKKVKGLDGVVKGLTKITAHYPLKLVKSKRLAPYVDALVHSFLGTEGYNIFTKSRIGGEAAQKGARGAKTSTLSSTREGEQRGDRRSEEWKVDLEQIERPEDMTTICYCRASPDTKKAVVKNIKRSLVDMRKDASCRK